MASSELSCTFSTRTLSSSARAALRSSLALVRSPRYFVLRRASSARASSRSRTVASRLAAS
eukprot:5491266-Alexandrium_andersonii.AAC.1